MSNNQNNGVVPSPNKRRQIYTHHDDNKPDKSDITPSAKVCRRLLPVNHAEVAATLDVEFRKHIAEKSRQWNFDFEKDEPLDNEDNGFQWIECQETGKENGQGSGTSWVALLQNNDEDDDVFTDETENHQNVISENSEIKPRRRLFGTSEDERDVFTEGRLFPPVFNPQSVGNRSTKSALLT